MLPLRVLSTQSLRSLLLCWVWLLPCLSYASFIESTIGTAVVNDATATYYNPAALTLVKKSQAIALGSYATSDNEFTGQATQSRSGYTESGSTSSTTKYFLPSLYLSMPATTNIAVGLAIVSNFFDRSLEDQSILRYAQSSNDVSDVDIVPAVGLSINGFISVGAGINISRAHFLLKPIIGIPSLNVPDSQSRNECDGTGVGGDIGILLKPNPSTVVGINYRSQITYRLRGTSTFEGDPDVVSNQYHFDFWTPARIVISANYFVTPTLGLIGTLQRIQWSIINEVTIHGIAAKIGSQSVIFDATVPYQLHDTWLLTFGSHYRVNPRLVVRAAASYNQSPGNSHYQIANGDSIIAGASAGYEIYKNIFIDGSYAHAFIANENIAITSGRNVIEGVNKGYRDAVSLKLTFNL